MSPERPIGEVLAEHTAELMSVPGVVAVAEGERGGRPCVKVYVAGSTDAVRGRLPASLDGYPVSVEASGPVRAR